MFRVNVLPSNKIAHRISNDQTKEEENSMEEQHLASAVIYRALSDVFNVKTNQFVSIKHNNSIKTEAINFLTSNGGDWKTSRHDWCDAASINPDKLKDFVEKKLKELEIEHESKRDTSKTI